MPQVVPLDHGLFFAIKIAVLDQGGNFASGSILHQLGTNLNPGGGRGRLLCILHHKNRISVTILINEKRELLLQQSEAFSAIISIVFTAFM
ncbi:hypothetical protein SADUNF_Sadunf12G0086400 [Salix dunnii]|uniref:Uncharacterized protein n=1 Tax=Salix dunnii TaxID=1413687 RepID=A0A835JLV9_9ROSI|nr:hypothetical protein SADUNF_Sadunf12G0086400 [Salix dunnii]